MRVLVCGGRDFVDEEIIVSVLKRLHEKTSIKTVIHGDAPGTDTLAGRWARAQEGILVIAYPADWETHGRAAGPLRNAYMLSHGRPDLVIAFPGGRGTRDMWRRAVLAKVRHVQVDRCGVIRGLGGNLFSNVRAIRSVGGESFVYTDGSPKK